MLRYLYSLHVKQNEEFNGNGNGKGNVLVKW